MTGKAVPSINRVFLYTCTSVFKVNPYIMNVKCAILYYNCTESELCDIENLLLSYAKLYLKEKETELYKTQSPL